MTKKTEVVVGVIISASFLFFIVIALITFLGMSSGDSLSLTGLGNKVAIVDIYGSIDTPSDIVRQIKKYSKDSSVPVILLHIDSPGGVVAPTQEIYQELLKAKKKNKKVVASMGALAASGAYYVACAADTIVADPGTVTGSIGVIMSYPVIEKLFKKIGVDYEVIKSSEFKDIGSPYRSTTPRDRQSLQEAIDDVYEQFVDAVVEGRGLSRKEALKIADGRIFSGRQAKELGLVDELGGFEDAIKIAGEMAGIKGEPRTIKEVRKTRITLWDLLTQKLNPFSKMDYGDLLYPKLEYIYR
ncbi:MAG: signal peptide peptidase SppA [candidate division Zixibacteria bacterium]|nr:signal peptide peptidase SppA [candidate division Zixibacteria bacterium]